jgi:hypothetical protein
VNNSTLFASKNEAVWFESVEKSSMLAIANAFTQLDWSMQTGKARWTKKQN